ncbi:hypothetical protein EMGBS8_15860 [Verrucomicrobiota bacterium]|nr:hypothetical protein EMGBS8_15860 [Verrucomicrobiota bacterium]
MVYDHASLGRLPASACQGPTPLSPDDRVEAMALAEKMSFTGHGLPHRYRYTTRGSPLRASGILALWSQRLEAADLGWLLWSLSPGLLNLDCLSAAKATGERSRCFRACLTDDGHTGPRVCFGDGIRPRPGHAHAVDALAPWRQEAYTVAIDGRVDTRLKTRDSHANRTANSLLKLSEEGAVRRSSVPNRYAESIVTEIQRLKPTRSRRPTTTWPRPRRYRAFRRGSTGSKTPFSASS